MSLRLQHPIISAALFGSWLALNGWSAGQAVLALVLALAIPAATAPLLNPLPGKARLGTAVKLLAVVLWDIGVANIRVARLVLGRMDVLQPVFVTIPLDAKSPNAIALLSRIVTITPGTTTVGIDAQHSRLVVHVLHTGDAGYVVANIKQRYERPLVELFGC